MKFKGYTLNPFQVKAAKALTSNKNVLVSAPTGAGKTLVAEYAIDQALRSRRKVIYTSPIKALSNQKYRDFKADGIRVGLMTGDLTLDPDAPIVIMTTEIFRNTIFEAPERFDDVGWLIFDEIHYLDDIERGTVWEESLIFAPEEIRLICLSATIQNLEMFGQWIRSIRKQELDIIFDAKRPVPLEHRLYHAATGEIRWEGLRKAQQKASTKTRPDRQRRGGPRRGGPQRRGGRRQQHFGPHEASRMLLDQLCEDDQLPVLYFCFSRRECEIKATRNAYRALLKGNDRRKMQRVFDQICQLFEIDWQDDAELSFLRDRALRGIGFHHAGMLPIHKEIVERLFTSGLLKLLFTTETFAMGINMPARCVCFDSLRKFDGVQFGYMKRRDYLQMAGRAGRQGIDYSVLDTEDLVNGPLKRVLFGEPEPIVSRFNLSYATLINLYERMGRGLVKAYEKSFSFYQLQKGGHKKRATVRAAETARILRKLNVLEASGYLDPGEGLMPRAKIARQINGYEIQLTELLFNGTLDQLTPGELAGVVVSIVYEERRGDQMLVQLSKREKRFAYDIEAAIRRFTSIELQNGFDQTIKLPDFGMLPATLSWCDGCDFEELAHYTSASGGDVVRTFRMAIQMLRQLQHALTKDYPLHARLEQARIMVNRDVVDAKRQLELG